MNTILVWAEIFLSSKTELKSKISKPFAILFTNKVNKIISKIWAESYNEFAVKMDFFYLDETTAFLISPKMP